MARQKQPWWFVLGIVAVLAVIALMYYRPSAEQPERVPEITMPVDSAHGEIATLEAMWKEHPTHAPIALQLGNLHAAKGDHAKAVQFYREFLKLDTTASGWEVRLDVSRSLHAMGKIDEAITEVMWILKRNPDHPGALYNLGAIEANRGNTAEARRHWEQLIAKHPQDTLAVFAKGAIGKLQ